uniref:Innexin n=1 Tax=Angiostrongylus cantonensis TaxID=6313 RepID=A0A0K0DPL7_ANGCA
LWNKMSNEVKWFLYDIAEAFEMPWEEPKQPRVDNQRLCELDPFIQVYTYSIARGWLASLILLLLWTQLSLNYLKATKNIDIGLYFLPRKEVAMPKFDITGAQMILDVAQIAQNLLNFAANFLEKVHSLLTWKDRRVTFVFYCLTIYWLTLSLIFSTGTCLGILKTMWKYLFANLYTQRITLGIRIFITTYLFHRFPRLRKRLDTYGWFYRNLPVKATADILPFMSISTEEHSFGCAYKQMKSTCGQIFNARLNEGYTSTLFASNHCTPYYTI